MTVVAKLRSFLYDRTLPGRTLETWWADWKDATYPQHEQRTLYYLSKYVAELRVLLQDCGIRRVLEIGCGDGKLFAELGFDKCRYRGVDFSPSMLRIFRKRFPDVDVVEADGSSYEDDQQYDLIFSNGVIQYFDRSMLNCHVAAARRMLGPKGRLVLASALWRRRRHGYCSGEYEGEMPLSRIVMRHLRVPLGMKLLGTWYDPAEIEAIGQRHGFAVEILGSMVCLYRFHTVLRWR
jgi:SAM-dependent methyltransferase